MGRIGRVPEFFRIIVIILRKDKTDMGREVAFLGLRGTFHRPSADMLLAIDLTDAEKATWADRIDEIPKSGETPHGELDSWAGRFSFSQTSFFERFGGSMMHPHISKVIFGLLRGYTSR